MYITREIEVKLASYLKQFKVVLVTGPRQTGKTTLLRHCLADEYRYVTLDDPRELVVAHDDPQAFLATSRLPIVIDEVQQAPDLFRQAKLVVDASEACGQIVLTGSQTYQLMKGVSESLAGRIGILELPSFSLREVRTRPKTCPYVPACLDTPASALSEDELWAYIQRGSMPRLQDSQVDWYDYYASYVKSYLERDVRQLVAVRHEQAFYRFMVACAARTGQLLNAANLANTVGVDVKTVQGWISVLQASGIIHILQPLWANTTKRLSKTPKLYFMDTGLACYLASWGAAEQLRNGDMAGHLFETFVVSEVLKSYMNAGRDTRSVSFYRDARKREIDLVIQEGHVLHPVEIKTAATVSPDAVKNFACLEGMPDYEVGYGHVICQTSEPYLITPSVQAVPAWAI